MVLIDLIFRVLMKSKKANQSELIGFLVLTLN